MAKDTSTTRVNGKGTAHNSSAPETPPPVVADYEDPFPTAGGSTPMVASGGGSVATHSVYDTGDLGTGFEDLTPDDVAVPFMGILQKGSPQVEEDNPKRVEGAKAGMIFNTATGEVFPKETGITIIPIHRVRNFLEWIPKDDGGGLVNVFAPEAPEVKSVLAKAGRKFGKLKIGDGNDLVETISLFCLLVRPNGQFERVVVSFASTQIAAYKRLMTMAQAIQVQQPDGRMETPPLFSHQYQLVTEFTQKKEHTWYRYKVAFAKGTAEASRLAPTDPLYEQAKVFRALINQGQAKAGFETGAMAMQEELGGDELNEHEM